MAEPVPNAIEAKHIRKAFTLAGTELTAIEELSFHVGRGEFFCVLGPSGCGKSTLLNIIAGLDKPSNGQLLVNPGGEKANQVAVGMVFQEHALFPWMSLEDNLVFVLQHSTATTTRDSRGQARQWLARVGLEKFTHAYPHQVSGGMRQRAAIARSFAVQPAILLMDEPFVHLDYQTRLQSQRLLLNLWQEAQCSVLFVTHDVEEAVLLSDRILIMSAHPGTAKELIVNTLPRPRAPLELKKNPEFIDLVNRSIDALGDELLAGEEK